MSNQQKLKNKAITKIGFGLMQLALGNTVSAVKCLEAALRALKPLCTSAKK
jgi:hypothetical protein